MPSLSQIASLLQCPAPMADGPITGVANLDRATETEISFLGSDRYLPQFAQTRARAVIVHKRVKLPEGSTRPILVVNDADLAVAKILELFAPPIPRPAPGIDKSARVAASAKLAADVAIGPGVFVGENTTIGRGTVLHAGVYIGEAVVVGEQCEFFPNVVVRERITIGSRVIIHANSAVGTDGFGYRWDGKQHVKIPQIGTVIIEDDVELGSCVCIDRAKFAATRVGRGTKVDNLVQIAHNVEIGAHCIIAGQAGMAGSVHLGNGVVIGGQVAVGDHLEIGDGAMLGARAALMKDVKPGEMVSGSPAFPHRQILREQAAIRDLPDLRVRVRKLQEELDELKKRL